MQNKKIDWKEEIKIAAKMFLSGAAKIAKGFAAVLVTLVLIVVLAGIIVVSAFSVYIANYVDTEVDMSKFRLDVSSLTTTSKLYYYDFEDRTNRVGTALELENETIKGEIDQVYVTYDEIPENMANAVIAIEDKRFRTHEGVDWIRTAGAGLGFLTGNSSYGGSTLTQQLIKNMTGNDDYKIQRKIQEIFWALDLETKMEKEEILELYLNVVNFGNGCSGVQAAAYKYFGKTASELTLIECAAIAGITQNPTKYNPITNPENNAERRNIVLSEMLDQGLITQREFDEAYGKELVLNIPESVESSTVNSWYTDMVIEDVINDLVEKKGYTYKTASLLVYNGGLNIYSLVDPEIQAQLEKIYGDDSYFPTSNGGVKAQSSAIIIHPETGDVLAVVGARGKKSANRVQNYATQTTRPAGSTLKPLSVYAPALEAGIAGYATVVDDTPFRFYGTTSWPKNSHGGYRGLVNVNYALKESLNTVSVKLLDMVGLDKSFAFCHDTLEMSSLIERKELDDGTVLTDKDYAALALGQLNWGVTVREVTAGYTVLANGGVYNSPNSYLKVTDSEGNVILENGSTGKVAISEDNAALMTKMLQHVIESGTASQGKNAVTFEKKTGINVAGKTGTSGDTAFDRWFIGYTPYYICGVWYGYEYPQAITGVINPCISLFDEIMVPIHQKYVDAAKDGTEELKSFDFDNLVQCEYCVDSGLLTTDACRCDLRGSRTETGWFVRGNEPTEYCTTHVLVDYDTSTGSVACDFCPEDSVIKVGLLNVKRDFSAYVAVTDAQYTYVELPANVRPYSNQYFPFYYFLYDTGHWCGVSYTIIPANKACTTHFDYRAWLDKLNGTSQ